MFKLDKPTHPSMDIILLDMIVAFVNIIREAFLKPAQEIREVTDN